MKRDSINYKKRIDKGGRGAEVFIAYELVEGQGFEITTADGLNTRLEKGGYLLEAAEYGVQYFYEHYAQVNTGRKLIVKIEDIRWLPVDSTSTAVFVAMVKLLCRVFDFEIEGGYDDARSLYVDRHELRTVAMFE